MTPRSPQIVAFGGGGFSTEWGNRLLDEYVLGLTRVDCPRVCFLPTASGDADHYVVRFYRAFDSLRCRPSHVSLFRRETGRELPGRTDPGAEEYRVYLLWADEKLEQWYRRLGERLREINPESAVYTWTTNAGRYGHFLTTPRVMSARMNRLFGVTMAERGVSQLVSVSLEAAETIREAS